MKISLPRVSVSSCKRLIAFCGFLLLIGGCQHHRNTADVTVRQIDEQWMLHVDGEPFYVKGAGGTRYLDLLAASGANSLRVWNVNQAERVLDDAEALGLKVMLGLWVEHERHGFDYQDEEAVRTQFKKFEQAVEQYKDHPALLLWGVGNEVGFSMQRPEAAEAVQDLVAMIQEADPHHPVTTVTAGVKEDEIQAIRNLIPALDFVSVNSYGEIDSVHLLFDAFGYTGPYLVTEWGPDGFWEVDQTDAGAPIEQSTNEKERVYYQRYQNYIKAIPQCMGSYVFLWGQKQERTHSWFGLFDEAGKPYGVVEAMQQAWNDAPFSMSSAQIDGIRLDGQYFEPSQTLIAGINAAFEVEGDLQEDASITWELYGESKATSTGGDPESKPKALDWLQNGASPQQTIMVTPDTSGSFRLFVTVEQNGYLSSYNVPFSVIHMYK